jgi:hypothetical protein
MTEMTTTTARAMATRKSEPLDDRVLTAVLTVGSVAITIAGLAAWRFGARAGISALTGGAVGTLNLYLLARSIGRLLADDVDEPARKKLLLGLAALLRVLVLYAGVIFLLVEHWVDPIAFGVGYLSLPLGIVVASLLSDRRDAG